VGRKHVRIIQSVSSDREVQVRDYSSDFARDLRRELAWRMRHSKATGKRNTRSRFH
jgi:hypothetical protein